MTTPTLSLHGTDLPSTATRSVRSSHPATILRDLQAIWSHLPAWRWIMPVAGVALLGLLACGQLLPWFVGKYAWTGKDFQEVLGPSLLGSAVVLALYLWSVDRRFCRAWIICLPAVLFCREVHFAGTGTGVYVGLAVIAVSAVHYRLQLRSVWNCSALCGWWFGAVSWYLLAVGVDSGVFKFLPHSRWWGVNLEETLESGGHLAVLLGVLCTSMMVGGGKVARSLRGRMPERVFRPHIEDHQS